MITVCGEQCYRDPVSRDTCAVVCWHHVCIAYVKHGYAYKYLNKL